MLGKRAVFFIVVIILLGSASIYTFGKGVLNDGLTPEQREVKQKVVQKHEVQEKAKKYGVDTNGLTEKQIKDKIAVKEHEELISIAKEYDIDTNGLSDEQIKEKVIAKQNEEIIAKAKNAGIDTDGLTPGQVIAKVNERDKKLKLSGTVKPEGNDSLTDKQIKYKEKCLLLEKAKRYGIDTNGLTDKQLKETVTAKENEIKGDKAGKKASEKDIELKKQRDEAEKKFMLDEAQRFNIDTTGLSYEQIVEKVHEKWLPGLVEKAKELGIDPTGLNYNQLLLKIKARECETSSAS